MISMFDIMFIVIIIVIIIMIIHNSNISMAAAAQGARASGSASSRRARPSPGARRHADVGFGAGPPRRGGARAPLRTEAPLRLRQPGPVAHAVPLGPEAEVGDLADGDVPRGLGLPLAARPAELHEERG